MVKVDVSLEQDMKTECESSGTALGASWGMGGERYTLATFPGKEAQYPLANFAKLKEKKNPKKVPLWRSLEFSGLSYR